MLLIDEIFAFQGQFHQFQQILRLKRQKIAQIWLLRFFKYMLKLSQIRRDNYKNKNNVRIKVLIGENFVLYGRFWLFSAFFRPFWLIGPHKGSTRVRLADQNFSIFLHNITYIWVFFEKKFQSFRWSVTISFTRLFEKKCVKNEIFGKN